MARSRRFQALTQFGLFCGILLFVNILANFFYTHLDLTEEKRFTLTRPTRALLHAVPDRILVEVLLDGEFPAGMKRLQTAAREMLDDFRSETGYIDYRFEDPNAGSAETANARRKTLAETGIVPVNLRFGEEGGSSQRLIYPFAIFHFGNRQVVVKLLENNSPSLDPERVINNSVSLLEYKFADAIKKLQAGGLKPAILFTAGHGELDDLQTTDLERSLHQFYDTDRLVLDSTLQLDPRKCALLVVAKPRAPFSEKDKFKIDQYVMNGGKVLWLIDRLNADLDSLRFTGRFVPSDYPLNLEDLLFKYGVRIQPDLVLDLESTRIPLQTGQMGNAPQLEKFKWFYHPAVSSTSSNPVVKNLDRVEFRFSSSIDTIRTKTPVEKTVLLASSKYSRLQFSPIDLNFDILRYAPDPAKFNKGPQILGVYLQGIFPSNYENRVSEDMLAGLKQVGIEFRAVSKPTRMIVFSDGDLAANYVRDREKKEWYPLGFNRFENTTYANKELLLNAVEYLLDPDGVIEARAKEVRLRLLDTVRAHRQENLWRAVNIGAPLLLLGFFGWLFQFLRRRRFSR